MKRIELNLTKLALELSTLDFFLQAEFKDLLNELNLSFTQSPKWRNAINKATAYIKARHIEMEYDDHTNEIHEQLEQNDPVQLENREIKSSKMQEKSLALHRDFALALVEVIKTYANQRYRFRFKEVTEHSEIETDLHGHIIKARTVFTYPYLIVEG